MTMSLSDLRDEFHNEAVRIDHLIWIDLALVDPEGPPEAFEKFVEWLPMETNALIYRAVPSLVRFAKVDEALDPMDVAETLGRTASGFLFHASRQARKYVGGGSWLSGWGHIRFQWFHARTIEEVGPTVLKWHEAEVAREKAEAGEKPEGGA